MEKTAYHSRFSRFLAAFLCILTGLCIAPATMASAASAVTAGDKTGDLTILYGIVFLLSGLLFAGYCFLFKKKNIWFVFLFLSVFVVNGGYVMLATAKDLEGAFLANQISYFGSAMLPLSMLLIIGETCRMHRPKWVTALLCGVSFAAFLLAASGSSLGLYYKEVFIQQVNGMTCSQKVYGPLHFLYTVYLFVYFGMMLAVIAYAGVRKKITSCKYVAFLASAVGGNLLIWFVEQLIHVNFEFLSVSYVITEVMLLLVYSMLQEYDSLFDAAQLMPKNGEDASLSAMPPDMEKLFSDFVCKAENLTPTERGILAYYADGLEIAEVAEAAFISIHTVRKHNANMYQKLGVGSRDELMLYLEMFRRCGRLEEVLQVPGKTVTDNET
jgi:DNA-binding CsgD family transcriptional regulator